MASFYVADVTLFDGRRVQPHRGVVVQGERIAWVGAHARAPREAARLWRRDAFERRAAAVVQFPAPRGARSG